MMGRHIYRYYTIYKITHRDSGKIYIGAHQTDNIDDDYMGSGKRIKAAIKKYGRDAFEKEILFENLGSMAAMYTKEAELVTKEFVKRKDTYNIHVGGNGIHDYTTRESTKRKLSEVMLGKNKGRKQTPEAIANWKKAYEQSTKTGMLGKQHSIETKNKISLARIGKRHTEDAKKKMSDAIKTRGHSQLGTCWIYNEADELNKLIKKEELETYITSGWKAGRKNF